jgi:uncharacterized protein (DUF111 family)
VKDHNDMAVGVPFTKIVREQVNVSQREGEIASIYGMAEIDHDVCLSEPGWNVNVKNRSTGHGCVVLPEGVHAEAQARDDSD